jgi:nitrite reductase/ring-hydroxylating ferredoxin subunit
MADVIKPSRLLATIPADAIPDEGRVRRFTYLDGFSQPRQGLLLRWRGALYAYQDRCPHWSASLGEDGEIFDARSGTLVCQMHGARFELDSGLCILGPCMGDRLEKFHIEVDEGRAVHVLRGSGLSL